MVLEVRLGVEDLVLVGRHQPLERMSDHHEAGHLLVVEGLENTLQTVGWRRLVQLVDQSPHSPPRTSLLSGVEEAVDGSVGVFHSGHVEEVGKPGAGGHLRYRTEDNLVGRVPDKVGPQVSEKGSIAPLKDGIVGTDLTIMCNISNITNITGTSNGLDVVDVDVRLVIRIFLSDLCTETWIDFRMIYMILYIYMIYLTYRQQPHFLRN